ncbi:MAG: ubiquinol-cytochrome c reductase iron-sulfur subunit [Thiotrichales bacterium]|nr:MAG: ubiquinol-cytochrome c reductase iron-sulfur subunit [Thiotrichales bacterium]
MMEPEVDSERRRFLVSATAVVGGVGVAFAAAPFLASWAPSARTQSLGAPIEVDISKIAPGQKITVSWRGQPIFIVNRTKAFLKTLAQQDMLRDPESLESKQPEYAQNPLRSIKEQFLVVTGICTHLGCVPLFKPKAKSVDASWIGGLFCPCHGSKYDMAGRVYKGVPAPTNLTIPPHHYIGDTVLRIGEHGA